jgi:hypothetical protein
MRNRKSLLEQIGFAPGDLIHFPNMSTLWFNHQISGYFTIRNKSLTTEELIALKDKYFLFMDCAPHAIIVSHLCLDFGFCDENNDPCILKLIFERGDLAFVTKCLIAKVGNGDRNDTYK